MKKKSVFKSLAAVGVLSVIAGGTVLSTKTVAHADATGAAPSATITVVGHGDKQVQPDVALVDAGIMTKAKDAQSAQQQNDAAMNKLMGVLKQAGIASNDVHTQWYNINPDYGQPDKNGQPTMNGFVANDSIEVVVKNLDKVGDVVDLLVKNGANQIQNVRYQVSNPLDIQEQLYDAALGDAKAQAQHIAASLGVTITGVQSVDTTDSSNPGPIQYMKSAASDSATPLSPGTQDVATSVRVVYTISSAK